VKVSRVFDWKQARRPGLLWSPVREQFVRAGILLSPGDFGVTMRGVPYQECLTIETNTNERRTAEGDSILRRSRRLSAGAGDRFIRWHEVDVRAERMAGFLVRGAERANENERAEAEMEAAELLSPAMPLYPFSPIS
jgi:hypothetical protein